MGFLGSVIKVGVKVGAVGGVLFLTNDQKLWSNAEEGERIYKELKVIMAENVSVPDPKSLTEALPEVSISPSKWNKGVTVVFDGIRHSPETLTQYGAQGIDMVVSSLNALNNQDGKEKPKE